jgi:hypothetical protein
MKPFLPFLAAALASCVDTLHYYGEEFAMHYPQPAEETRKERVDEREILRYAADSRRKERVGLLYKYETQVAGSREVRESYMIYNSAGTHAIGLITAEGVFYRFDERGRLGDRMGEYPILPTGLKVFLGLDIADQVELGEIDPYK